MSTVAPVPAETRRSNYVPGLEGIVAAQTRLSRVDGEAGELVIAGFPVEALAPQASYEEVVYLLWHDALPNRQQLAEFRASLAAQRAMPEATLALLQAAARQKLGEMDALRMAAGSLSLAIPDASDLTGMRAASLGLLARMPVMAAAYWRLSQSQAPIAPRADLGEAANYLYMLFGQEPAGEQVRGLETYLNTVVDHGLNASTFTARVIVSTGSDLVSAIVGAIGALKGPRHGGAPGPALDMVFEIGTADRAEAVLRAKLDRRERLMGFGHRVYKVRDPRADVLAAAVERFFGNDGDRALYDLARHVERVAVDLLAERYPQHSYKTNVEFYTALLLHGLGLPTELFTPTFAVSRTAGWIAHSLEQDRLIRPQSEYIGPNGRQWTSMDDR